MDPFAYSPGTGGFGAYLGQGAEAPLPIEAEAASNGAEAALPPEPAAPHEATPDFQPVPSILDEEEGMGPSAYEELMLQDAHRHDTRRNGEQRIRTTPGAESGQRQTLRRAMQRRQPVTVRRARIRRPQPQKMSGTTKLLFALLGLGVLGSLFLYLRK
jgi:hypothetical protein